MIVEIEMMLSGLPACYSIGGVPVSMARWSESMIIVVVEMEQDEAISRRPLDHPASLTFFFFFFFGGAHRALSCYRPEGPSSCSRPTSVSQACLLMAGSVSHISLHSTVSKGSDQDRLSIAARKCFYAHTVWDSREVASSGRTYVLPSSPSLNTH